ncbi:hypothetical protein C8R47DRAFT_1223828 [Mycena vitilis]|nr:hypothetical protein C8R47DRAFT_1223828 [Mycena vitilis]
MTTAKTLEDIRASVTVDRGVDKQLDNKAFLASREIDTAATVVYGDKGDLDPAEALRIRRKIDLHILPLMCILYL